MIPKLFHHHIPYIEMIGQMDMGVVLLAVKSDITSSEYSKSKNIEFIAAKIQLSKQKPLIIGSYYRPPNKTDDIYTLTKLLRNFPHYVITTKVPLFGLEATSI